MVGSSVPSLAAATSGGCASLAINNNAAYTAATGLGCTSVGSLSLTLSSPATTSFPGLAEVLGDLTIDLSTANAELDQIYFPDLRRVTGTLLVRTSIASAKIGDVLFPKLSLAGAIVLGGPGHVGTLESVDFATVLPTAPLVVNTSFAVSGTGVVKKFVVGYATNIQTVVIEGSASAQVYEFNSEADYDLNIDTIRISRAANTLQSLLFHRLAAVGTLLRLRVSANANIGNIEFAGRQLALGAVDIEISGGNLQSLLVQNVASVDAVAIATNGGTVTTFEVQGVLAGMCVCVSWLVAVRWGPYD